MGVILHDTIQTALTTSSEFEFGLLLGDMDSSSSDFIIGTLQTPSEYEEKLPTILHDISVDWMISHALQVASILPGGIRIVGIYIRSIHDSRSVLIQAQQYVHAIVKNTAIPCLEGYAIHVHASTSKMTCWKEGHPIDMQWKNVMKELQVYTSIVPLSMEMRLPMMETKEYSLSFIKQVEALRAALQDELDWTMKYGVGKVEANQTVQLYQYTGIARESTEQDSKPIVVRMEGQIYCAGYVYSKGMNPEKLQERAIAVIKQDYIRSVLSRMDILTEEWDQQLEAFSTKQQKQLPNIIFANGGMIHLPRRALIEWNGIYLSLYMLREDNINSISSNTNEILNLKEPYLLDTASIQEIEKYDDSIVDQVNGSMGTSTTAAKSNVNSSVLYFAFAVIVILLAILIGILFQG